MKKIVLKKSKNKNNNKNNKSKNMKWVILIIHKILKICKKMIRMKMIRNFSFNFL